MISFVYKLYKNKRSKIAKICLAIIIFFVLIAIFAPFIAPFDPDQIDLTSKLKPSGALHLLGTDEYGRDILSRLIFGARSSLLIGLVTTSISVFTGVILGTIAGYYGGIFDEIISRVIEILYAFPDMLFAIGVMFVLGPGIINLFIALGILGWTGTARLIRAKVLTLKEKDFIKAAKLCGASNFFVIKNHILPNCVSTIIIIATMGIPGAILSEAALSFLGLGVQPPTASWGSMISFAKTYIRVNPSYSVYPGICIILVVIAFNLFGDYLRDALDPSSRHLSI